MNNTNINFKNIIEQEKQQPYFKELMSFLDERYQNGVVYPPREKLFSCFELCNPNDIKVVILGQDPYHQKGQAMGLSFSVERGVRTPKSLVNIYKELHDDIGCDIPTHGDLSSWAKQGVLMMNRVMSVEDSQANVHANKGWETFTNSIIKKLNDYPQPLVFILWGKPAQDSAKWITDQRHLLLKSVHPSPLSSYRGFFGSKPFSQSNAFLKENNRDVIDWSIKE